MTDVALSPALAFYARHGSALFPIPAGSKAPGGIVASFAHDHSASPEQWSRWAAANPGCNFGLVAGPSRLIIADVDISELGRDRAWAIWSEWWTSRGIPVPEPHVQSARGGWHTLFRLPDDAPPLRQIPLIGPVEGESKKAVVDLRVGNGFTVAAGSYYDGTARGEQSGSYILLTDAPPHAAPDALIQACTRATRTQPSSSSRAGSADVADTQRVLEWMAEHDAFASYDEWFRTGMLLRSHFGDDPGFALWQITNDGSASADYEASKWESFADKPVVDGVGIGTLRAHAKRMGCPHVIRDSLDSIFGTVAQIAHAAGATLSSAPAGMPLADTQKVIAALGQPIVDNFLAGTKDAPLRPSARDYPTLPDIMSEHPLFAPLQQCVDRILAMAEGGASTFRQHRVIETIAVLSAVHQQTCESLCQRISALGGVLSDGALNSAVQKFEGSVRREIATGQGFITDSKGFPAPENSDNVYAFIRQRGIDLRFNVWKQQVEVSDAGRNAFLQLTDHVFGDLLMDAENTQFNYHPSEARFRRGLISHARKTMYDPLVERVDRLADAWDGKPRLISWLTQTCGVPCDTYHQSVGRNLIGALVRRARQPGCVQAETVIFISPNQGTGKSTLTKILALEPEWHTDSFKFGGSQQNAIPQLAGKWVVELSDLAGMNKADVEEIKSFLSSTVDNFTAKYEAFSRDHLRRCVFIGTSNDKRPLIDSTGNRRFLPVHVVGEVDTDWLAANIDQLIGEAAHREAAGEEFAIPRGVWEEAARHQEAARNMTPVEELCQEWFDRPDGHAYYILASDIGRALDMAGQNKSARYASFLDKLGWRSENVVVPATGRKCRVWIRAEGKRLAEYVRLVPTQSAPKGPVDMRMQMAPTSASTQPALPPTS